jgi:hypothetical protein
MAMAALVDDGPSPCSDPAADRRLRWCRDPWEPLYELIAAGPGDEIAPKKADDHSAEIERATGSYRIVGMPDSVRGTSAVRGWRSYTG